MLIPTVSASWRRSDCENDGNGQREVEIPKGETQRESEALVPFVVDPEFWTGFLSPLVKKP